MAFGRVAEKAGVLYLWTRMKECDGWFRYAPVMPPVVHMDLADLHVFISLQKVPLCTQYLTD
jgi:hypothetical protein